MIEESLVAELVNGSSITAVVHLGGFFGTPEFEEMEVVAFGAAKMMTAVVVAAAAAAAAGVFVATVTDSVDQITVDSLLESYLSVAGIAAQIAGPGAAAVVFAVAGAVAEDVVADSGGGWFVTAPCSVS
ncbi:hypothetical protein B296_00000468 [Ensete ventricosum]|uniref:Uncharacterized protein n=1 Tax=Ensete ventricosum TaxID=4639 RepID=A0A427A2A7_ENSVE|nr:hypothetical protein B296_00000468 [Ensete ventricosum]